jgi:hypothetical protein
MSRTIRDVWRSFGYARGIIRATEIEILVVEAASPADDQAAPTFEML